MEVSTLLIYHFQHLHNRPAGIDEQVHLCIMHDLNHEILYGTIDNE